MDYLITFYSIDGFYFQLYAETLEQSQKLIELLGDKIHDYHIWAKIEP